MVRYNSKKAQAAMEYLFVVGFAFALLIPVLIIYYTQSVAFEEEVIISQARVVIDELGQAADAVYFLGFPSKKTIQVRFPTNVQEVYFEDQTIIMRLDLSTGSSTITKRTQTNITGLIQPFSGLHVITLRATPTGVEISE